MAHPNEDVVRQAFAAYGRGDIEALRSQFLAPDIRWHRMRRSPLAGHYEGADSVVELYKRVAELSGGRPPEPELHDVIGNDDHIVALHNLRMVRAGQQLEINAVLVFHVRDGKITEAWDVLVDQDVDDEFWP